MAGDEPAEDKDEIEEPAVTVDELGEEELGTIVELVAACLEVRQANRRAFEGSGEEAEPQGWFRKLAAKARSAAAERAKEEACKVLWAADARLRNVSSAWEAVTTPKLPLEIINPARELELVREVFGKHVWNMLCAIYSAFDLGEDGGR